MSNKMLIDASHPEETRVVVTKGHRIEEFDFESEHKKQLKGNIYLARVTRVEPSLQAAFVEYGGNRHGFLAFSEIHPDYYQIPVADRQALLEAEERSVADDDGADSEVKKAGADNNGAPANGRKSRGRRPAAVAAAAPENNIAEDSEGLEGDNHEADEDGADDEAPIDLVGAEDVLEEMPKRDTGRRGAHWRDYKIQEVVKRRQILLVQIIKEERGNKGAALTTYLSLAGRYSVLMPNTARGGGISRKITNMADRKRLKDIVKDLSVPRGMGIILRTAGAARTKTEVRRDYEYLMRLWENVRNLTLTSMAPALVYEEGSLIKRSIRDLYNKDIDEISVAGDKAYREAKDFMRMLMPSHAKFVQPYRDPTPIFARRGIEAQLDGMLQPEVGLKSGGYLVINQTEALVAIDVNSGRSTREHSVEETALQTNLEAAEEIARQLRLRDLAGLIVIDFIDMQEKRNIRNVEKRLKDCLKGDRARIQVGRISHFGLMEMSRQRIRASVLESTTEPCPHCFGQGYVRSQSSLALHVLRVIEEYLQRSPSHNIMVRTPVSTALYVLNHKRQALTELEQRFGLSIGVEADDTIGREHLAIHKTSEAGNLASDETEQNNEPAAPAADESPTESAGHGKTVKSKAGREKTGRTGGDSAMPAPRRAAALSEPASSASEDNPKRRRRRGRRGGRRNRDHTNRLVLPMAEPVGPFAAQFAIADKQPPAEPPAGLNGRPAAEPVGALAADETEKSDAGKKAVQKRRNNKKAENRNSANTLPGAMQAGKTAPIAAKKQDNPANNGRDAAVLLAAEDKGALKRKSRSGKMIEEPAAEPVITSSAAKGEEKADKVKKKGWWGRRSFL
ncbi:MAG: S1 RNA-binding domain-containing protein [Candidatus Tokpelaia sp.]|nr:MAG: S1 RNA-binding domain-containing protein [Candidatus Tokpelaia sp.]KAA6207603.1 MAG: S1 RNA-binding domain-containing protein [Candidatus Tokpelaia sp.]